MIVNDLVDTYIICTAVALVACVVGCLLDSGDE